MQGGDGRMIQTNEVVSIDLGCGPKKKEGYLGIDYSKYDGVDYVIDLTRDRFPFEDKSVDNIHSSHFIEHIRTPDHVFSEIGRVAKDGATLEMWHPYSFHSDAFLYGHEIFLNENHWYEICVNHPEHYYSMIKSRWLLNRVVYVVEKSVYDEITTNGFDIGFAIKYFKNIVKEIGIFVTIRTSMEHDNIIPDLYYAFGRNLEAHKIE
ncbi:hypothetical protein PANG_00019 [Paenibacillus phage PG1]|uniref:hypothetical protein n=1 Tax=Paenibacillus phage PG1 TaxID=754053 RepID=UPI0003424E23|nr:hypothetical protein PANG_00019 [Paenibacillus phage PG1]AGN33740.1 hypothetical protein PANG_00019 [Paenibacillus phage PG1]